MIVNFLIIPDGPWPTLAHEGLHHLILQLLFFMASEEKLEMKNT